MTAHPYKVVPVGVAGSMPGTDGFTMAAFRSADVPIGTPLYAASPVQSAPEGGGEAVKKDAYDRCVAGIEGFLSLSAAKKTDIHKVVVAALATSSGDADAWAFEQQFMGIWHNRLTHERPDGGPRIRLVRPLKFAALPPLPNEEVTK
jgi:hypothetical protein